MDASVEDSLRTEAFHVYFSEVKDAHQETEFEDEEEEQLNGNYMLLTLLCVVYYVVEILMDKVL